MWERYNISAQQAQSQGKTAEAENFHRMALAEAEKIAHNDPKVVMSLNSLANCLRQQGRYTEAEPLYKKAIDLKEKTVGVLHTDLVSLLDNYAKMLRLSGRAAEADKLDQRAQKIFSRK
jgi:tetratricopeptide (TPR) repeat protein